jgi:zinc protease
MPNLSLPNPIPHRTRTLANGLQVVAARRPGTGTAAVQVWVKVGAKDDPQGKAGFAHLFEHLMFKRTRNLPDEAIDRLTEDVGGENNAFTTPDVTVYHETIPANHLQVLLWAEAERLGNLLVTGKAFASERDVVKEEYRQGVLAPPYGRFDDAVERLAWTTHPYRNTVIGNIPELDAATLADVRAFHKAHYRTDNAVLVVAGDFDDTTLDTWIDQTFGRIPVPEPRQTTPLPTDPPRSQPTRHIVNGPNIPLPAVAVNYRVPNVQSDERHALALLDSVLASGKASRLHRELVQRRQLASESSSWLDLRTDAGLLQIRTVAAQGVDPKRLESAIEDIVADLREILVPANELARVRDRLLTDELKSRETADGIAFLLGGAMVDHRDPAWADRRWQIIAAITPEQLRETARRFLVPDNRTTVVGVRGPAPAPPQSSPSPASTRDNLTPPPPDQKPPKPGPPATARTPAIRQTKLANAATVLHASRPNSGLVSIGAAIPCGSALDPKAQWGRSSLLADVLTRGSANRNAEQVAAAAEELGGTINADATRDAIRITLTVPSTRLEPATALLADIVRKPRFLSDEIKKARNEHADNAAIALEDPGTIAAYAITRLLFGDAPQGVLGDGLPATLKRIQRTDLAALWSKAFRPEDTVLAAAGDCTPEQWFAVAKQWFGNWTPPSQARPRLEPHSVPRLTRQSPVLIGIPGIGQAAVAAAVPTIGRRDPGFPLALVANSILGGGFSARLNREVRIKRGLAYGAFSSLAAERLPGMFVMSAQTRNGAAADVAAVMKTQLRALSTSPLESDELEKRKAALLGPLARRLETGDGTLGSLLTLRILGLPLAELDALPRRIAGVGSKDIRAGARQLFPEERLQVVVVGDPAVCRGALKRQFGTIREISLDKLDLQRTDLGIDRTVQRSR